ncbi:hypothetical protein EMPS_08280 [Entomortierella parvispora]|uniref:Homoserine dehydrogenase n=1 Tax=Entomortierella parvispora TaxID=205924 RepID=A0A9P3LZA0_9FUNG|nr:hypothetical protein EMPS_08280 [Entomortierella parvispora]
MVVNVAIVGVGLVGSEFIRQVIATQSKKIAVVAVANSRSMHISDSPLVDDSWKDQLLTSASPFTLDAFTASLAASKAARPTVVLDCTSNETVAAYYPTWLRAGFHVVTPNKKAFSGDLNLYKEIVQLSSQPGSPLVYHESTVGAGLPVINTLNDLVNTGDKIVKIEGIFSGTLSYIFNNFSTLDKSAKPVKFSEVVSVAKELGYTEPDPRDDLNGMDVARKVIILGRVAGLDLTQETVNVENIVPEELRNLPTSEFMEKLPEFDAHFEKLNQEAIQNGQVLRYVGLVDPVHGKSSVTLARYPASHPFASLKGSDNIIAFTTERFPNPLIIQGAGAGAAVTAFGIYSDILKIAERTRQ